VDVEGDALVPVDPVGELRPVFGAEARRVLGDRGGRVDRLVAREDAAPQEAVAATVDGELEVAVQVAVGDPPLEGRGDVGDLAQLDDAADLSAAPQPEPDGRDHA